MLKKPAGLPVLGNEEAAIVIGYDFGLLLRHQYCEWCLFWDSDQGLALASLPQPAKIGLVIVNAAVPKTALASIKLRLRKQFKGNIVTIGSGMVAIESVLQRLFGAKVREGKRGPLTRTVFVRPDPDAEYKLSVPEDPRQGTDEDETDSEQAAEARPKKNSEKRPKIVRPGGYLKTDRRKTTDLPVRLRRNSATGEIELVTELTREQLIADLELDSSISDKQLIERIFDKLGRSNTARRKKA